MKAYSPLRRTVVPMVKVCQIEGCDSPLIARGYCHMHYRRWRLTGSPGPAEPSRNRPGTDLAQRFWSFVERGNPSDCWLWISGVSGSGHGQIRINGQKVYAHRVAYELVVGPIPDGLFLDHMCHNRDLACPGGTNCTHRRCVNPAHLEPATRRENQLRGRAFSAVNAAKTHCIHGHPFDEANTIIRPGNHRGCRECGRIAQRAYQQRKKAVLI
jgi:hypothetical protein